MALPSRIKARLFVVSASAVLVTGELFAAAAVAPEKTLREVVMSLASSAVDPPEPDVLAEAGLRAVSRAFTCVERSRNRARMVLSCGRAKVEAPWPPPDARAVADLVGRAFVLGASTSSSANATDDALAAVAQALTASLGDPYTQYLPARDVARFSTGNRAAATTGIGLAPRDATLIRDVRPGSDAEAQGLLRGERILYIDDRPTTGMTYGEVNNALVGASGSIVRLVVGAPGAAPRKVMVARTLLEEPPVTSEILVGDMLYVRVSQFVRGVAADVKQEIWDNQSRGVVLDLRHNPGGLIQEGAALLDLFFTGGVLGGVRPRPGRPAEDYKATHEVTDVNLPLVVLVDGGTASASELVTLVLKERGRATVLGSQTMGKGSVQQVIQLPDGGALRVTSAHYVGARGERLDTDGVPPHVFLPPPRTRTVLAGGPPALDPWVRAALDVLEADDGHSGGSALRMGPLP